MKSLIISVLTSQKQNEGSFLLVNEGYKRKFVAETAVYHISFFNFKKIIN